MNTTLLRLALLNSSVAQLEDVIDWLDRPWAPGKNDALRAAWHEARRSDGARRALAFAIEDEVRSLSAERDVAFVAQRLELGVHTPEAVVAEIARRLGGLDSWPLPFAPELVVGALRATADIARLMFGARRGGRHHRGGHARRHRHGR